MNFSYRLYFFNLFFMIYLSFSLESREIEVSTTNIAATQLKQRDAIPITLEYAKTEEQMEWGLMGRRALPANHGMLFFYPAPQQVAIWMFNCFIDLSVAFLDEEQIIRSIRALNAFPNKMDPKRPVRSIQDLALYPPGDPIRLFFEKRVVISSIPAKYSLEMNLRWFQENGVRAGDAVGWDEKTGLAWVMPALDISSLQPSQGGPIIIEQSTETAQALTLAHDVIGRDIAFMDAEHRIVKLGYLPGGERYPDTTRPVIFSNGPIKYTLVAMPGWLEQNGITVEDELVVGTQ